MSQQIVIDTNIFVAAIRSRRGAAFRLVSLVGTGKFDVYISVPLVLEYETAMLKHQPCTNLSEREIDDILDYVCAVAIKHDVFFLWRPRLRDPKDDMVLETAIAGGCSAIVTYNKRDFVGARDFNISALTPHEFLTAIGEEQ